MSDRTDYDLTGFAVSGLRALGRPDQADAIERLTKDRDGWADAWEIEHQAHLEDEIALKAGEDAMSEARAALSAAVETADQRTMDMLQIRTEIAAIHDMLTDEPPCWAEGISRLRMLRDRHRAIPLPAPTIEAEGRDPQGLGTEHESVTAKPGRHP